MKKLTLFIAILAFFLADSSMALPDGFVYLKDLDPTIIQDMRYSSFNNFVGHPVKGYEAGQCILTKPAALALAKLQQELRTQGLGIKVYDCYRPQVAVDEFVAWSRLPANDRLKQLYYPRLNKRDLFKLGYIAAKSGHSRGSTVDMTLVRLVGPNIMPTDLNMGTTFDLLDELSHTDAMAIQGEAKANRLLLRRVMTQGNFTPLNVEWWHFTLQNEPFPDTYFNFPVV